MIKKRVCTRRSQFDSSIAFVFGTRPEAIKLAPVILRARAERQRTIVISTGQQADLVRPALATFDLTPDHDLNVMRAGQPLSDLTARCLSRVGAILRDLRPAIVVVQGDTASALAGAMAAFFERIPAAHVEAGLRTGDLAAPFPEEANRQVISRLARLHFAPTVDAKANLLGEGIDPESIEVTGNTVVDALRHLGTRIRRTPPPVSVPPGRKLVLVTAHRRENLGPPLENICSAVRKLAARQAELHFVFITHPNPVAARTAHMRLANRPNITLLPPLAYIEMLRLVSDSWLILTDSGGLQEEAPSFRRPVLVLRDRTERTEGVASGDARVVGTRAERIVDTVVTLLHSPDDFAQRVPAENPYGDGLASERIVRSIRLFVKRVGRNCELASEAA